MESREQVGPSGLIDLGEDWAAEPPGRVRRARVSRWPAVVIAALALALTGSAAPQRSLVAAFRVPMGAGSTFVMADGGVYIAAGSTITAYAPGDGRVAWRARAPFRPQRLFTAGTVILAQTDGAATGGPLRTLALDGRSGRVLWTDPALVDYLLPGSELAVMYTVSGRGPAGLHAVRLRTGQTVWSGPQTIGTRTVFDLDTVNRPAARVAFWVPDGIAGGGTVQVVARETGRVIATSRLPLPGGAQYTGAPVPSWLSVAADRLLVAARIGQYTRLSAYRLDTLTPDWQTTVASTVYTAADCGPVLCLYGAGGLVGLDPASGEVRWSTGVWAAAYSLPGGRLLLLAAPEGTRSLVAEAASLRPVSELPSWMPVAGAPAGPPLLSWGTGTGATRFAVIEGEPGGPLVLRPLGSATGIDRRRCVAAARSLACPTIHNGLQVWRYR